MQKLQIFFIGFLNSICLLGQNDAFTIDIKVIPDIGKFRAKNVICGAKDKAGFIWFGGRDGLFRYDGHVFKYFDGKNGLRDTKVVNLIVDKNNHLIISYSSLGDDNTPLADSAKDVINCDNFSVQTLSTYYKNLPFRETDVHYIVSDGSEILFGLSNSDFEYKYNQQDKFVKQKKGSSGNWSRNNSLFTRNDSLFLLLETKLSIGFPAPLKDFKAQYYFKFSPNCFWLFSNKGLVKIQLNKKLFNKHFSNLPIDNNARGIYVTEKLSYFILGDDLGSHSVKITGKDTIRLKSGTYLSICKVDSDLWIGSNRLVKYNFKEGKEEEKAPQIKGPVWAIGKLNKHTLILGTDAGAFLFDKETNRLTQINFSNCPRPNRMDRIININNKRAWMIAHNGIYVLDSLGQIIDFFSKTARLKSKQLPCSSLFDAYIEQDSICWIATKDDGLVKWNIPNHTFKKFGSESGILSNTLYQILEDDFNNLWISTNYGLVKFDKHSLKAATFTEKDGITDNEFNGISSFKDENGILYFGGINGITSVNPKSVLAETKEQTYPFLVTQINLFNNQTNDIQDITLSKRIDFKDNIAYCDVTFSLLDFEQRPYQYAYKIEGLEDSWSNSTENFIRLRNLPYGAYTLKVKVQNKNAEWCKQEISIPINVIIPFYKTKWFLVMVIILLIGLVIVLVKKRLKKSEKLTRQLEIEVQEKTKIIQSEKLELEKRNNIISAQNKEKDALLQEVHHRVKNNLQLVAAMLQIQTDLSENQIIQTTLQESSRRINSMALVHEMLYVKGNSDKISLKEYLLSLVNQLDQITGDVDKRKVRFDLHLADVTFSISDCIAFGMITSEIVSNSVKYAFNKITEPCISINLTYNEKNKLVSYKIGDNGNGVSKNVKSGLGLKLIDIFARQLKSAYSTSNENGFVYTFEIAVE